MPNNRVTNRPMQTTASGGYVEPLGTIKERKR